MTGITTQNWRRTMDTNLSACVWACRDVARHMVARRQGSILVVASVIQFHPAYNEAAYRVSKVGLKAYAETLAIELAPFNVRVNVSSPGLFPTKLGSNLTRALRDPVLSRTIIEWVPMRRVGDPAECGAAAAFLLSDRVASYITGADVVVDGGFKLRPRGAFPGGEARAAHTIDTVRKGDAVRTRPVLGPLWNVGCKVLDVRAEVGFLEKLGGRLRLHETLPGPDGPIEYALVEVGGTRMLLTPTPVFEAHLEHGLRPGLTHAVFEVVDHRAACRAALEAGARPLTSPRTLEAGFGKRMVAFFESPGGLVFEVLKIIEAKV